MKNRFHWYNWYYLSICIFGFLVICGIHTGYTQSALQPQTQNLNQNSSNSGGFGTNQSFNSNQNQNQQFNNSFGSNRSSRGSLSGRSRSNRSSRRGNDTPNLNNGIPESKAPSSKGRTTPSRPPSTPSSLSAPGSGSGGSSSGISFHGGSGQNADAGKTNGRQNAPEPRIAKKSYLYLVSSNLSAKVGEPFTVDVRLSGLADTKFDALGFQLKYEPEEIMPIQGQGANGEWLPAAEVKYFADTKISEENAQLTSAPFLFSDSGLQEQTKIENTVLHPAGLVSFSASLPKAVFAKNLVISRMTFVALKEVNSSRIQFETVEDSEHNSKSGTFLLHDGDDVLGYASDPTDGVIPLDIMIPSGRQSGRNKIAWLNKDSMGMDARATLELIVDEENNDVGDTITMKVVLNNPGQLPVDEVEFLIGYNTRVLEIVTNNTIATGLSSGLRMNQEKGILQYKHTLRNTSPNPQTTIAVISFKAKRPTTKTTFKVLVHKDGSMPSTGASFKGRDVLGDPLSPTDGINTASLSIRPTVAYLQQTSKRF